MQPAKRTVDLRRANRQVVLRHLYFNSPLSRLDLSQQVGLSSATVTNVVSDLLEAGVVKERGVAESEGGRPRTLLVVNPRHGYLVGVDVGETHVQLELFDLTLRNQSTARYVLTAEDNAPERYAERIGEGLTELLAQTRIKATQVLGVGIGVPGVVERMDSVNVSAPMWGWRNVPLIDMLAAKVKHPIYLDNGVKAMALAESWFGAGRGVDNLVVVLIGTGVGAAVITQGTLYRGASNSAGEWGHSKIMLNGRACRCGSVGCVEAYVGAPGIIATLRDLDSNSPLLSESDQLSTLGKLARALEQNDSIALETLRATTHYLGVGVANLVNLFNPERIVIGGWAGLQIGEALMRDLPGYVSCYALPSPMKAVQIDLCQFGEDAVCMGAACLVLDSFLNGEHAAK